MQTEARLEFVSVEDYLAGEEGSDVRHEYLDGLVYAMAGGTSDHHQIALNFAFAARSHVRGKPCRVFVFDFKVRAGTPESVVFYYPDAMVGCDPRDTHKLYLRFPSIILEVSSDSTERLDRGEKRTAYQTIETLQEYLVVAQDRLEATLFRRANKWQPEVFTRLEDSVALNSIGLSLSLAAIYEGVALAGNGVS